MKDNITANAVIHIHTTAARVWEALTNPELIRQYFFGTEAISKWEEGSPIVFQGEWEGRPFEHRGLIRIFEQDKLFRYDYWSSLTGLEDQPENYLRNTYELFEEGGVTMLAVTQDNIPSERTRINSEQNWRKVLNKMKGLLESEVFVTEWA